jgi:2-polyprenyl-3-methyl-5-hydroxy-6-metoxy-1,4-benzoquinol methylase
VPVRPTLDGPPCPACGALETTASLAWGQHTQIHRCASCALLFAYPVPTPEQLEAFYQGFLYRRPARKDLPRLLAERQRELVSLFGMDAPGARAGRTFLDHGGGTGAAYAAAQRIGLESSFAEMDRQAIAYVTEEFGLPSSRLVNHLAEHPGQFDYVLSDNVVEHVIDPVTLIRELVASLKPGGVLVIKTPHAAASDTYFYPRVWSAYAQKAAKFNGWSKALEMLIREPIWCCDPPRHLYSFSKQSLASMARRAGLDPAQFRVETYQTPLLKNSFTERVLQRRRGVLGGLRRAALIPMLPVELASKVVQGWSRRAGWLAPGGLVLRVRRDGGLPESAA